MPAPLLLSLRQRLLRAAGALTLSLLTLALNPAAHSAAAQVAQLQLQARLFHSGSGTLSADVLAPGGPELVNVVASADPSTATLVVVAVKLAPDAALRSTTPVRLLVQARARPGGARRVLLDRSLRIGAVARGGTAHLGFWLQGTGCEALDLRATLKSDAPAPALVSDATLPFACGE